jgi:hypothetical protein
LDSYGGSSVTWQAIVSTPTVAANSRLPADNIPIYLPSGALVAPTGQALWQTIVASLAHAIDLTPTGLVFSSVPGDTPTFVWTGSNVDGSQFVTLGNTSVAQATRGVVRSNSVWVTQSNFPAQTEIYHLYAFSPILTVIPEPGTLALIAVAAGAFALRRR